MLAVNLLLFFFAAVGHAAWLVCFINFLYSTRFRGWWITGQRWLAKGFIVLGPLAFLAFILPHFASPRGWVDLHPALLGYVIVCWTLGFIVVPYQTVRRWRRRDPPHQLLIRWETHDLTAILGRKPAGTNGVPLLARAPFNEIFHVDFTERVLELPQLPAALDGLTILHLTDLHLCGLPDRSYYEWIIRRCMEQPAELIAITGDLVDSPDHHRWIIPVLGRLRWSVAAFAVLGNHDTDYDIEKIRRRVRRLGIDLIGGGWKEITLRGERMTVIGNEFPWLRPAPDLAGCPADAFRLCLSHSPDTMPWAKQNRIDLMLAGHNHGGQVRLPGFGPILVPSRYSRRYDCGLFYEEPTLMHVGRGLGATHPLRWNCRPEVTRLVLKAKQA
jgi:hypothetical protein